MKNNSKKRSSVKTSTASDRNSSRVASRSRSASASTRNTVSSDIDSVVLDGVVRLVTRGKGTPASWNGSMTELNLALRKIVRRSVAGWPENPRGLRARLDRVVNKLRRLGVKSRFGRMAGFDRKRFVEFTKA